MKRYQRPHGASAEGANLLQIVSLIRQRGDRIYFEINIQQPRVRRLGDCCFRETWVIQTSSHSTNALGVWCKKKPEKNPTYANFTGLRNVPRGSEGEMIPLATVKLDDFEVISADQYSGSPISLAWTKQLAGHMDEKREALLLRFAFCFSCANNYSCALRRNET